MYPGTGGRSGMMLMRYNVQYNCSQTPKLIISTIRVFNIVNCQFLESKKCFLGFSRKVRVLGPRDHAPYNINGPY